MNGSNSEKQTEAEAATKPSPSFPIFTSLPPFPPPFRPFSSTSSPNHCILSSRKWSPDHCLLLALITVVSKNELVRFISEIELNCHFFFMIQEMKLRYIFEQ
ncbi:hypothetical protein RHGRI_023989 [Rhododendron griersonianum]|uniref:Uncharacterized protein n=1 Tax=Rhododendron griersonianum TaxID=479676 RepID=A0AAV6JB34_9ERIC|nr:hypothetical protein RHGRI_023989 [Rhododendron griersonianum]